MDLKLQDKICYIVLRLLLPLCTTILYAPARPSPLVAILLLGVGFLAPHPDFTDRITPVRHTDPI